MYSHNFTADLISSYPDKGTLIFWLSLVLIAVFSYIVGSFNFGIFLSKILYKDDIREHGSGNAGATNMLRTHGTLIGVATLLGDAAKAFISILAGALLMNILGIYVAGFFCIVGHIFPIFYGFKGGKGVVVTGVMIAFTDIRVFLVALILFIILVAGTKYISLGSVICVAVYPILLFRFASSAETFSSFRYIGVVFAFFAAALVIWKHRENIRRIYNHTESKFSFKKKGSADGASKKKDGAK